MRRQLVDQLQSKLAAKGVTALRIFEGPRGYRLVVVDGRVGARSVETKVAARRLMRELRAVERQVTGR